jgi:hypothetical protein
LEPKQKKLSSISPLNQFLIALRFYGTGSFWKYHEICSVFMKARFDV